ncbi:hypothetical protein E3Q23_04463, partial [Wallemia mellicola]
ANHSFAYRSPISSNDDDNCDDNHTDSIDDEEEEVGEEKSSNEAASITQNEPDPHIQEQEEPTHETPCISQHDTDMEEQEEIPQEETSHISQNDIDERAQEEPETETYPSLDDTPMQVQEELPKETLYTPQNGTDTQEQEELPKATSYPSHNNPEEQEQVKSPYVNSPILHNNDDTNTEKPVGQTSPNANTYDIPAPIPVKTIYDRFDKQEEFPNEYLGFNHSSKRKAPPTRAKGTLIQPGQARHAARVSKQQEDDRLSKAEDAKTDIHYDRLQEQWSQFNDDKKRIYPDPAF